VNTNPVIIRRCLGDLRRASLVCVRHGAGAGWTLARAPEEIILLEVCDAVGPEPPFGLHHAEPNLECPVGKGIRPARNPGGIVTSAVRYPVVELRQYTLRPDQREVLIEANATMIDSDNVLLRPVSARSGFPAPSAARPPVGAAPAGPSRIRGTGIRVRGTGPSQGVWLPSIW
jgi:hypothetical protein